MWATSVAFSPNGKHGALGQPRWNRPIVVGAHGGELLRLIAVEAIGLPSSLLAFSTPRVLKTICCQLSADSKSRA